MKVADTSRRNAVNSRLENYRNLEPAERVAMLAGAVGLTDDERALLSSPGALPLNRANGMIENVVGTFELPFGVATNCPWLNGRDYLVPMAGGGCPPSSPPPPTWRASPAAAAASRPPRRCRS